MKIGNMNYEIFRIMMSRRNLSADSRFTMFIHLFIKHFNYVFKQRLGQNVKHERKQKTEGRNTIKPAFTITYSCFECKSKSHFFFMIHLPINQIVFEIKKITFKLDTCVHNIWGVKKSGKKHYNNEDNKAQGCLQIYNILIRATRMTPFLLNKMK